MRQAEQTARKMTQLELAEAVYYWKMRQKALEAHLQRVDPYSETFEKVMGDLFEAREEQRRLEAEQRERSVQVLLGAAG